MTRRRIYKRSRNDGGVPQIHYTEDGDNDSNQSDLPLSAEAFTSLAFRLLGARTVGNFRDDFGGQVLWVYRTFAKGLAHHFPRNLKLYAEGDQEVINRMLPQAKEEFRNRLQEKLSTAVRELSEEVYKPIYEATGQKWDVYPGFTFDEGSATYREHLIKRELKGGHILYRTLKSERGRPPQLEAAELEKRIRKAVVAFKKRNYGKTPTLKQAAEVLSKRQPITEPALKMRMKRAGMVWKELRK